jgi:hypothetical protein
MSLDRLVQIIHSSQQGEWSERDEEAFKALFGSPEGDTRRLLRSL